MHADVIVLTHKKELKSISVTDLKLREINFTNWFCPITDHVILASHDGTVKSGICSEVIIHNPNNPWWESDQLQLPKSNICTFRKRQCFCNADLKSPKAIHKKIYKQFLKIAEFKDYPYVDPDDKIYAIVGKQYLESPHFEFHIDIGKRCNFDCSYCPPTIHDNFSPFLTFNSLEKLIDMVEDTLIGNPKDKKCILTGGEPTLFKELLPLIDLLQSKNYKVIINTNGSASKSLLTKLIEKHVILIVSLHNEFTNKKLMEKIKNIKEIYPKSVDIKYMGKTDIDFYTSAITIIGKDNMNVYPLYNKTDDKGYKL
jgi:organic radical activating enzyme